MNKKHLIWVEKRIRCWSESNSANENYLGKKMVDNDDNLLDVGPNLSISVLTNFKKELKKQD